MSLFCDPSDLVPYGRNLAQLLLIGGVHIETLAKKGHQVTFKLWCDAVAQSAQERKVRLEDGQLAWLWEALITEPKIRRELGSRILFIEDEWKKQKPITVLSSGQ